MQDLSVLLVLTLRFSSLRMLRVLRIALVSTHGVRMFYEENTDCLQVTEVYFARFHFLVLTTWS